MIQIRKIHLFISVLVIIVLVYYFSNRNYKPVDTKKDLVSLLQFNKNHILDFEESINSAGLSDSNFYTEHRFKENKFYFFRLKGGDMEENFDLPPEKYNEFKNSAASLNVKNIWKYADENFYTLVIRGVEKLDDKKLFILLLKKSEKEFLLPSNSSINANDTTSLFQNFGNNKNVFVLDRRIWVILKDR